MSLRFAGSYGFKYTRELKKIYQLIAKYKNACPNVEKIQLTGEQYRAVFNAMQVPDGVSKDAFRDEIRISDLGVTVTRKRDYLTRI